MELIVLYLIVGVLTTLVNFITYYVLTISMFNPNNQIELQIVEIISWIVAVTFAYFANRIYVFQKKDKVSKVKLKIRNTML